MNNGANRGNNLESSRQLVQYENFLFPGLVQGNSYRVLPG